MYILYLHCTYTTHQHISFEIYTDEMPWFDSHYSLHIRVYDKKEKILGEGTLSAIYTFLPSLYVSKEEACDESCLLKKNFWRLKSRTAEENVSTAGHQSKSALLS